MLHSAAANIMRNRYLLLIALYSIFLPKSACAQLDGISALHEVIPSRIKMGIYAASAANKSIFYPSTSLFLLQEDLRDEYGIEAINRSDVHSPLVLKNLLFLLRNSFHANSIRSLKNLQYFYAYYGHDDHYNIGAYHSSSRAISFGGLSAYPESNDEYKIPLLAALAHEIGHAFLLEKVTADELLSLGNYFGNWSIIHRENNSNNLFSPVFFKPHPILKVDHLYRENNKKNLANIVSEYSLINLHEWFADAFAAAALQRLGRKNLLGRNWREKLMGIRVKKNDFWYNYNNLPPVFQVWLDSRQ